MRPSEVRLGTGPFFLLQGVFDSVEAEAMAALLVWTCARLGDEWQPCTLDQIIETAYIGRDEKSNDTLMMVRNPFLRPSPLRLVESGGAIFDDDDRLRFTEEGLRRLERWTQGAKSGS